MAGQPGDDYDRDILDIIPARYDADADSRQARAGSRLRTTVTLVAAVVAVGGIVAAGWHFMGGKKAVGPGVPVIKADERPIKIRPDDRGGMQVPNQDKLIYERLEQGEGDAKVERLLPAPEKPQVPAKPAVAPAPVQPVPVQPAPVAEQPKPVPHPAPVASAQPPAPAPEPAKVKVPEPVQPKAVEPVPAKAIPAAPPPAPPVPPAAPVVAKAPPAGGDYLIQLGALRSAPDAEKEWSRIQKTNADLLGSLKSDVVRVELGEKGVFWRLRAGPLSEAAAKQMCLDLKTRNQGCIVARK